LERFWTSTKFPTDKAKMNIPLCWLFSMSIVWPTLKIDVLKMKQAFFMRYEEGKKAFYNSPKNFKAKEKLISKYMPLWSTLWTHKNAKFEKFLLKGPNLSFLCGNLFHVWDRNHRLQAWWPYIDLNHPNEEDWYISINAFVLDTTNGLIELLITMTNLNK